MSACNVYNVVPTIADLIATHATQLAPLLLKLPLVHLL